MSGHTYRVFERVGSSEISIEDAITKASKTVREIGWFEMIQTRGHVVDGKVQQSR